MAQLVKESACNAGDPGSIPGLGRSIGEGIGWLPSPRFLDFPGGSAAKESTCNVGEMFSSVALFTFPTERLQLLFEANIFTPGK